MAGREMTAWIAVLVFFPQTWITGADGWAAASYQYVFWPRTGIGLAQFPPWLFLGIVMMPFYYISKKHTLCPATSNFVSEASRALQQFLFAADDRVDERHHMYSRL